MLLTICTPTYNRAGLLGHLHASLLAQTDRRFEWVVVDDGSTDGTPDTVRALPQSDFPIRYIRKENGGKHTAVNEGVRQGAGDMFMIVDSDDRLAPDAVERILDVAQDVAHNDDFAGVSGTCRTSAGEQIGSGLPRDVIDADAMQIRYRHHVSGDLSEVFKTGVLRQFPFPEISGERFCPEALVWFRIARAGLKLRYFNEPVYIRDYQQGGLTERIVRIRMDSPVASTTYYRELALTPSIPGRERVKAVINYWRFRACSPSVRERVPAWWHALRPAGAAMHRRDLQSRRS